MSTDDLKAQAKAEKQKVIEKVRKILAKAGNNPSAEEAAAAAALAEQMLAKYNIQFAEVQVEELHAGEGLMSEKVYANINVGAARKISDWAQWLAVATAEFYDCHCRLADGVARLSPTQSVKARVIEFVGYELDVKVCAWMYGYLFQAISRSSLVFAQQSLNTNGIVGNAMKGPLREFRQGASLVLCARLRAMREERDTRRGSDGTSTALVQLKRQTIDDVFGGFKYADTDKDVGTDMAAFSAGAQAGQRIDLNVRGVGADAASPRLATG